jgi:hypothetical protein
MTIPKINISELKHSHPSTSYRFESYNYLMNLLKDYNSTIIELTNVENMLTVDIGGRIDLIIRYNICDELISIYYRCSYPTMRSLIEYVLIAVYVHESKTVRKRKHLPRLLNITARPLVDDLCTVPEKIIMSPYFATSPYYSVDSLLPLYNYLFDKVMIVRKDCMLLRPRGVITLQDKPLTRYVSIYGDSEVAISYVTTTINITSITSTSSETISVDDIYKTIMMPLEDDRNQLKDRVERIKSNLASLL